MKIAAKDVDRVLRAPGSLRAILLFGDDEGLIRERACTLLSAALGHPPDPFAVAELAGGETASLAVEARTGSLGGGLRVLRVRHASDALADAVQTILNDDVPSLTLLEAVGLPSRSRLRAAVEASGFGAAIGCYAEGELQLRAAITRLVSEADLTLEPAALAWLATHLGGDRALIRQELQKLILYATPSGRIELSDALACVGELADLSMADALDAAMAGNVDAADRALSAAIADGLEPIALIRASLAHLQQLSRCRFALEAGVPLADAMKLARPPVFFRRADAFRRALARWNTAGLELALDRLLAAERACKSTGVPAMSLCRQLVAWLSRQGPTLA